MADGLLAFCFSRGELLAKVCKFDPDLEKKRLEENMDDICPFSVMARFNRTPLGCDNRAKFAESLAPFLGVSEPVPEKFDHVGIPTVQNRGEGILFFDHKTKCKDDIDTLWEVFARALALVRSNGMDGTRAAFICSYNKALEIEKVYVPKLTKGLYWIRPWFFLPLDECSEDYIKEELRISEDPRKEGESGEGYLKLRNNVAACFNKKTCSAHSFPELAWWPKGSGTRT